MVTIIPVAEGTATITLKGTDVGGSNKSAMQTINVTVIRVKMYWVDRGTDKIQRANIKLGQGEISRTVEDLITTGLTTPVGIAMHF